jgi:hypothetical protein
VQRGDDRHADFFEEGEQVAASGAAIDAELMLDAEHIGIGEVQKIRCTPVGVEVFFQQLKADAGGVVITFDPIIDGTDEAVGGWGCCGDGLAEVMSESGNTTEPRKIISEEGDPLWQSGSIQFNAPSDCDMSHQTACAENSNPGF